MEERKMERQTEREREREREYSVGQTVETAGVLQSRAWSYFTLQFNGGWGGGILQFTIPPRTSSHIPLLLSELKGLF